MIPIMIQTSCLCQYTNLSAAVFSHPVQLHELAKQLSFDIRESLWYENFFAGRQLSAFTTPMVTRDQLSLGTVML